ncbi:hypothetical protein BOS5A_210917 [Bosea sp. EC-HK365B]|nr:hypothetical protein BOSE7B_120777 [Bosea sp. 7B]CAD5274172.1 hypothetical protein BOSE21B_30135 [Bosea sp. 21B]VVT60126.1 hypothetical protein BOS5A_210917 [Bosea sp. EC-HK365B]
MMQAGRCNAAEMLVRRLLARLAHPLPPACGGEGLGMGAAK